MADIIGLTLGIFLLIAVGITARRVGLLRFEDRIALNNIIIFISLPSLIFTAARQARFDFSLVVISILALVVGLLTLGFGYLVARLTGLRGALLGSFLLASGVGNTGYLGYPITQAIFGRANLVKAVFFDIFGTVVILFTAGIYFANKYGQASDKAWRRGLSYAAPNLTGLVLGFGLQDFDLPVPVDLAVNALADATTGIIMLSIGISLSRQIVGHKLPVTLITLTKLAFMPLLALAAAVALNLDPTVGRIAVLQSSMPIALMTFVIADQYRLNREFFSGAILLSTFLSMLTIPLWQAVARYML